MRKWLLYAWQVRLKEIIGFPEPRSIPHLNPVRCAHEPLLQARIKRLVFAGARSRMPGQWKAFSTLPNAEKLNHRIEYVRGICAPAASEKLRTFFRARR